MKTQTVRIVSAALLLTLFTASSFAEEDNKKITVPKTSDSAKIEDNKKEIKTEAVKAEQKSVSKELKLTMNDTGKTQKVKVGETVMVELSGNPTTGFTWSAAKDVVNSKILSEANGGMKYIPGGQAGMVGSGGIYRFYWKATAPGETKIKLEYKRSWEKTPANRTMEATIIVEAAETKAAEKKSGNPLADKDKVTADKTAAKAVSIHNKIFSDKDSKKTVDSMVNDQFTVRLAGNPTTGYAWELSGKPNKSILILEKEDYSMEQVPRGFVGGGGNFIFKFKAVGKGTAKIRLEYKRSWEKDVPPAETYEMTVNVK